MRLLIKDILLNEWWYSSTPRIYTLIPLSVQDNTLTKLPLKNSIPKEIPPECATASCFAPNQSSLLVLSVSVEGL
jgi:hypothetical protein